MTNLLLVSRYLLFCLFVICNAMICISAVWNHSLTSSYETLQVDVYLAFLGAFSLVFVFTLVFVELLIQHPFTTRIWFESTWIVMFWLMELAGATAVTWLLNNGQCGFQGTVSFHSLCTSAILLVVFTWTCTGILLVYLPLLICTAIAYQRDNPDIWNSTVRRLRWSVGRQSLRTPPSSPIMSRFSKRIEPFPAVTYAPQPVRPIPRPVYIDHDRAGLGSEYEIERYQSPQHQRMPVTEQMSVEVRDSIPEAIHIPLSGQTQAFASQLRPPRAPLPPPPPAPVLVRSTGAPRHPIYDSFAAGQELSSTITYSNRPKIQQAEQPAPPSHPAPLGNWPRQDIMEQPVKRKRRTLPTPGNSGVPPSTITQQTATAGVSSTGAGHPGHEASSSTQVPLDEPRARRPSGPRLRILTSDLAVTSQRLCRASIFVLMVKLFDSI
ncbi:hypothetical protein V8B97DRAFT_1915194 [Scleroderma yunnanense]